ncbi:hypothetical protein A3J90_03480 [candidate division WOR-1 bacterium RIFOXYC2_FULL_37_10]|uniref:Uncharacterized protein n=1 Tax=candidate division WOR-1 bacterium RIFOXYB2_FULL_37_13 TaxID=1802579 RepID=A0A1F4SVD8_UNCSA|nr:MAG: hypothetical protein A2310_08335 [candidate division WOR-1 bacterium RIFOXYB2_FULL_37_13]OGC37501.1 MAG: hypothetical protein A3J90_03480 [candidate division WOR-1 bacterium RIFOXYC2_FULL_37_10]
MKQGFEVRNFGYFLLVAFFLLLTCLSNFSNAKQTSNESFVEQFRIKIINTKNGEVSVSKNFGETFQVVGHVVYPAGKINPKGFTATQWIGSSEVAATSVNAIHVKVDDKKGIFSIVPKEFLSSIKNYKSYLNSNSSIYTDIPASKSIFGGGLAPFVGNEVYINGEKTTKEIKDGDLIIIVVKKPVKWPESIVFENKFAGKIFVNYPDGKSNVVGEVLRPVQGVGRFEGSMYLNPGRIRANHPGVIDISTSTAGRVGGFQIIPAGHAQSPEMSYARIKTQWMVVSMPSVFDGTPEGKPPLFKYFLKPQYDYDDINAKDWENKFLSRFLVEVMIENTDKWQPMPVYGLIRGEELPDYADTFLKNVEKIKILFPQ